MVRIFDEVDIAHVEGNVDPIRDIEIIHNELRSAECTDRRQNNNRSINLD